MCIIFKVHNVQGAYCTRCIMFKVHNAQMTELTKLTKDHVHKVQLHIAQCERHANVDLQLLLLRSVCCVQFTKSVPWCYFNQMFSQLPGVHYSSFIEFQVFISTIKTIAQYKYLHNLNICSRVTLTHTPLCIGDLDLNSVLITSCNSLLKWNN